MKCAKLKWTDPPNRYKCSKCGMLIITTETLKNPVCIECANEMWNHQMDISNDELWFENLDKETKE